MNTTTQTQKGDDLTITKKEYEAILDAVADGNNEKAYILLQRLDRDTYNAYNRFD